MEHWHKLDSYDYSLPEELIAQQPLKRRDASRLMVLNRARRTISHRMFSDLPGLLDAGDLLVANNSKVFPARLNGVRLIPKGGQWLEGGKIEFLALRQLDALVWEGLFRSTARQVPGLVFTVGGIRGEILSGAEASRGGAVIVRFERDPFSEGLGAIPLPPYIERAAVAEDVERYQTVYASVTGSAAAPTAGLHFTPEILEQIRSRGVGWTEVTLHVGLGTFRPVKCADIRQHEMHEEHFWIPEKTAQAVDAAARGGARVVAVGTTALRTLQSAWDASRGVIRSGPGATRLFMYPGWGQCAPARGLITNFHLPKSTLLMLVCAFAEDPEWVLSAYEQAILEKYRFFSYGDAMLIL